MKKIINLSLLIGMLSLIVLLFNASERASGSATSETIGIKEENGTEQIGPPWLDNAWHYRRPVIIINNGSALPYYQVLITLNDGNFDFNLANTDGSDVRFTHSDGTTLLDYWIESWDNTNHIAYIWVRIPGLANGNTAIYVYYDNSIAISESDGTKVFRAPDFFDDCWMQFPSGGCTSGGINLNEQSSTKMRITTDSVNSDTPDIALTDPWFVISGTPDVSSGILSLVNGTGIKSTSNFLYQAVGFKANFTTGTGHVGTGHEWGGFNIGDIGKGTMIGDLYTDASNLYLINYNSLENDTLLPRIGGVDWHNVYHTYEIRWKSGWSEANIDHSTNPIPSTIQVPSTTLPVTFYSYSGSNATLLVDWVYVRQYRDPEPTCFVEAKQGLVDLGIDMVESPDPIHTNAELTYQITITNNSNLDASGVIITDTLPGSVQYIRSMPADRCSQVGSEILCSLNTIVENQTAGVAIVVNPTIDGVLTNSAIVASLGYDSDMSNNGEEVTTLVDSIPPNVNWENPVHNGLEYTTNGGLVGLEASATDNDQVAWVEFWYWDHLPPGDPHGKVTIGIDYSYPYQMQFNSDVLVRNEKYQVFVQAADRAGNISSIYQLPHPVIYITRNLLYKLYLPVTLK
jgi:uncharacterized repeat protein (TIGR01451 family)